MVTSSKGPRVWEPADFFSHGKKRSGIKTHLLNHVIITHTVDGKDPANQLRLVVYPIICLGFDSSQVVVWDF